MSETEKRRDGETESRGERSGRDRVRKEIERAE